MLILFSHRTNFSSKNSKNFYLFATLYQFLVFFSVFTDVSNYINSLPNQQNFNNIKPWTFNYRPDYPLNTPLLYRPTIYNRSTNTTAFYYAQAQFAIRRRTSSSKQRPRAVQVNPKNQINTFQNPAQNSGLQSSYVPKYLKPKNGLPMFPLPVPMKSQNVLRNKPLTTISSKPPQVFSERSNRARSVGTSNLRQAPRKNDQTILATNCFHGGMDFVSRNPCDFKQWPNISSIADDQKDFCKPYFEQGCKVGTNWKFCVQGRQATANSSSFNTAFDCSSVDIVEDNESMGFQCCKTCQIGLKVAEIEKKCIEYSENDFPRHMFNQCCSLRLKSILEQDLPKSNGATDHSADISPEKQIGNVTAIPLDVIVNVLDKSIRPSKLQSETVTSNSEDEFSTSPELLKATETSIPILLRKSTETSTEGSISKSSEENIEN